MLEPMVSLPVWSGQVRVALRLAVSQSVSMSGVEWSGVHLAADSQSTSKSGYRAYF
jgi:hypothetical protein